MMAKTEDSDAVDWLMEGDPSVRWQVMRDLLDEPEKRWAAERRRVATEGWGRTLLDYRDEEGVWGGGLYTPKWTSTNYTLLTLRLLGMPRDTPACAAGASLLLGRLRGEDFCKRVRRMDLCVVGMYLALGVYFMLDDARLEMLLEQALATQMDDGGWNCAGKRREVHHSSLHTTINILDGLGDYVRYRGSTPEIERAMRRADEFILRHRLFRSDKTGEVIKAAFTKFSFPPRWRWDVLRGLEYLREIAAPRDERARDAIDLLVAARCKDGRWKLQNHHRGVEFFRLEPLGQPSRINTLRCLRVLRWWNA